MAYGVEDRCCIKRDGVTDTSRELFGNLLSGAAIAAAAYNASRAVSIATKEWEMAKKYWQIAENWLDHYKDNYAPVEDQEVAEARALQDEEPKYDIARGRARTVAWLQFRGVLRQTTKCTSRYCTGLRQDMLVDMLTSQADAVALNDSLGYRNERAYIEARADERFKRQFETAKRGRNMLSDNVSLGRAAAGIYGNLFEQAWTGLEGAGQYLGYWGARHQTAYPTSYLSSTTQKQQSENNVVIQTNPNWSTGQGYNPPVIQERNLP